VAQIDFDARGDLVAVHVPYRREIHVGVDVAAAQAPRQPPAADRSPARSSPRRYRGRVQRQHPGPFSSR
jgi:hypothetical protein